MAKLRRSPNDLDDENSLPSSPDSDAAVFLTPFEVSEQHGINLSDLFTMRKRGTGPPFFQIGFVIRYLRSDVEEWRDQLTDE